MTQSIFHLSFFIWPFLNLIFVANGHEQVKQ